MNRIINFIGWFSTELTIMFKDPVFVIVIPILCLSVILEKCGVTQ